MRLSRESVWTAVTPARRRSTYMAHNSGWSKPVWNLFATIMTLRSSPWKALRRSPAPGFREASVASSIPYSASLMMPENATNVPMP